MTTISIALTTFNGERFLPEQLESLARQTRLPDEIVITDDASTDDTLCVVKKFSANAPFPVKVYRNAVRLGWARNFVRPAQLCTRELIAFCDQDDLWQRARIAETLSAACEMPPEPSRRVISPERKPQQRAEAVGGRNADEVQPRYRRIELSP
jgi:glycosyltransferase involved in cell wall biosynthesis